MNMNSRFILRSIVTMGDCGTFCLYPLPNSFQSATHRKHPYMLVFFIADLICMQHHYNPSASLGMFSLVVHSKPASSWKAL